MPAWSRSSAYEESMTVNEELKLEEAKHSAELKRNHCTTNVIGEELKWRKASYFCAQNRWKCEEEFFFFKKLYFKVVKDFPLKKILRKTFIQLWGKRKR